MRYIIEEMENGFLVTKYKENHLTESKHVFSEWDGVVEHLRHQEIKPDLASVTNLPAQPSTTIKDYLSEDDFPEPFTMACSVHSDVFAPFTFGTEERVRNNADEITKAGSEEFVSILDDLD